MSSWASSKPTELSCSLLLSRCAFPHPYSFCKAATSSAAVNNTSVTSRLACETCLLPDKGKLCSWFSSAALGTEFELCWAACRNCWLDAVENCRPCRISRQSHLCPKNTPNQVPCLVVGIFCLTLICQLTMGSVQWHQADACLSQGACLLYSPGVCMQQSHCNSVLHAQHTEGPKIGNSSKPASMSAGASR